MLSMGGGGWGDTAGDKIPAAYFIYILLLSPNLALA